MKNQEKHLYKLHELSDYKVVSDDPDIRSWEVRDIDNRVIGKVDNLLVNKNAKRVVYLDVEVDETIIDENHDPYAKPSNTETHEFLNEEGENHIIVPIGMVRLDEENKLVRANGINHRTFAETKRYRKGDTINREYEIIVLDSYNRNNVSADDRTENDDDFYNRDEFNRE
ncbi:MULTISPECIES: PRC-barrel domain-containing protein [Aequorivita]|uniref:PRC-barrel domain-containing protein n=1 Tax=Aequorivita iocasae TaxID=2803865 RepID=A0ABX7DTF1_9FLAO|nr:MULTISPECIES: PRC-barrel domain-containing protein [Aequorivita]QQX76419.1 PRC-barrel domain-containing protein [Aequorivita iocasae]UCA55891.1 PRC-barrel domain-containing protein [Aequorivita sp. F7]